MRKPIFVALIALGVASMTLAADAHAGGLHKLWESAAELKVPESVYFDAQRQLLYVTNIDGKPWEDDGQGSLAKLTPDGKIVAREWVTGLSAPKGMALKGSHLYVADMKNVVVVDVETGKIAKRIPVSDAQGLNDVTLADDGTIYVSDSLGKKVFALRDDAPTLYLDNLAGPNGLLHHGGDLYVLDGDSMYTVDANRGLKRIAGGISGVLDGLEPVSQNEFLLSTWQGTLHFIHADGSHELLLDTRDAKISAADIGYDRSKRIVYIPTFNTNTVVAYELH